MNYQASSIMTLAIPGFSSVNNLFHRINMDAYPVFLLEILQQTYFEQASILNIRPI